MNIEESIRRIGCRDEGGPYPRDEATGKFSKALMTKVFVEEEMGGIPIPIQYTTDSKECYKNIKTRRRTDLRKKVIWNLCWEVLLPLDRV